MATPHIRAEKGDIAKVVLMPGDPLRAKVVADTFLNNAVLINDVRNCFGYTGTYKGKKVSVMASGMGMGSIGIYSYELYKFYDVEAIIRIGSAGSYDMDWKVYDVCLCDKAYSESSYSLAQCGVEKHVAYPDQELNEYIVKAAEKDGIKLNVGTVHSSDPFYHENDSYMEGVKEHNCKCVEMESFALFHNADVLGKKAACLLTISDSIVDPNAPVTTHEERRLAFVKMMQVALDAAVEVA